MRENVASSVELHTKKVPKKKIENSVLPISKRIKNICPVEKHIIFKNLVIGTESEFYMLKY